MVVLVLEESIFFFFLASRLQPPKGFWIFTNVDFILPQELFHKMVHRCIIKVLSPEVSVSCNGLDIDNTILKCENRHVQSKYTFHNRDFTSVDKIAEGKASTMTFLKFY
jgi:hypothetical protein